MMGIVSIAAIFLGVLTLVWLSLRWRRQDRDRRWQRIREAADVERETYARVRCVYMRTGPPHPRCLPRRATLHLSLTENGDDATQP